MADLTPALGRVVRRRRLAAGLSQERLAEAAGLHRTYVSWLERGRSSPTLEAVRRLGQALGVPASMLVAEAEDEASDGPDLRFEGGREAAR